MKNVELLILHRAIQRYAQPMSLIHMPAGEDAGFFPERANQSGIAFEIHHADFAVAHQPQILSGYIHNHSKPFFVSGVAEHQKTGIPGEKLFSGHTVSIREIRG